MGLLALVGAFPWLAAFSGQPNAPPREQAELLAPGFRPLTGTGSLASNPVGIAAFDSSLSVLASGVC